MLYTSNFVIKEIKGLTMITNTQDFKNEYFKMGSMQLKIKIIEKF